MPKNTKQIFSKEGLQHANILSKDETGMKLGKAR
jgi:hypothetical protein